MGFKEGEWVTYKTYNGTKLPAWIVYCDYDSCTITTIQGYTYKKSQCFLERMETEIDEDDRKNLIDEALRMKDREWFDQLCKGDKI